MLAEPKIGVQFLPMHSDDHVADEATECIEHIIWMVDGSPDHALDRTVSGRAEMILKFDRRRLAEFLAEVAVRLFELRALFRRRFDFVNRRGDGSIVKFRRIDSL